MLSLIRETSTSEFVDLMTTKAALMEHWDNPENTGEFLVAVVIYHAAMIAHDKSDGGYYSDDYVSTWVRNQYKRMNALKK